MEVHLREAMQAYLAFVFDVRRQAFRPYLELEDGWNEDLELKSHFQRFGQQRFRIIVAGSIDVGYLATAVYPATTDSTANLYVHQLMLLLPFQSKGIGSTCLQLIRKEARALGLPVRLRVLRVSPRALAFYVSLGSKIIGESDSHIGLEYRGIDTDA